MPVGNDIDRLAESGPDIVVVDPRRHHVNQRVQRTDLGRINYLALPCVHGLAEAVLANGEGMHLLRNFRKRRTFAEVTQLHTSPWVNFLLVVGP